ncbi:MAG: Uma2 family endonuclease [Gemmataceae bacterium]
MSTVQESPAVRQRRWSKDEFYRLAELGFFQGQRVELIGGRLMVASPQNPLHAAALDRVGDTLRRVFGTNWRVRCQVPLDLGPFSEPEPDFSVVVPADYSLAHPTSAELIVEVSDSTLAYDRAQKGSLYAASGLREYWIVNLVDRMVEVYRDPVPDSTQPFGQRYASRTDLVPPASVAPLALPQASILVADLLP